MKISESEIQPVLIENPVKDIPVLVAENPAKDIPVLVAENPAKDTPSKHFDICQNKSVGQHFFCC